MENSYNVLELKFNGDMSQVCKALKFYLEKNEYEASPIYDDSYQYSYFGKDPSLYCGYTWKFLIKEQSLFILSFIDQRKFFKNKKYASNNKIYNTDYTDINNKRFALIDMQKGTTRALEILVNYFKENKNVCRRACTIRNGASGIPYANRWKRTPQHVGAWLVLH